MARFGWVEGESVFDPSRWDGLSGTPFSSWSWLSLHRAQFGTVFGGRPIGLEVFEGRDRIAYWPLIRTGGLIRRIGTFGVRGSDYLPPLVRADARPWEAIEEGLRESRADLVRLSRLRSDETPWPVLPESRCLVLDLPNTFSAYVGGLSKSLRADLNRGQELRITDSEENLDHLFSLHARRWRRRGWPGAFLRRSRAFHRALEVPRSIYALWEGERPIGALYVLHGQGTTYFYQSGFDPAFGRQSPGSLLIGHAIREAIARGQTQFDFLRGDEPYKRRWKPTRVLDCGSVLMPLTRVGEAAAGWAGAVSRVEATARRRFEGDGSTQIVRARRSGAGSSA